MTSLDDASEVVSVVEDVAMGTVVVVAAAAVSVVVVVVVSVVAVACGIGATGCSSGEKAAFEKTSLYFGGSFGSVS